MADFIMTISDSEDLPLSQDSTNGQILPPKDRPIAGNRRKRRSDEDASEPPSAKKLRSTEEDEENILLDPDFEFEDDAVNLADEFDLFGTEKKPTQSVNLDDLVSRKLEARRNIDFSPESADESDISGEESDPSLANGSDDSMEDAAKSPDEEDEDGFSQPSGSDENSDDREDEDDESAHRKKAFFEPERPAKSRSHSKQDLVSFSDLHLSRPILRGIAASGFVNPTPIQKRAIPIALEGKDVVGGAITGSGKTAAFLLPILQRLLHRPTKVPTSRVAILMPTRELAIQCHNVAAKLAQYTDITFCRLIGGSGSIRGQETQLKARPDVIIATPGRFIDHMRNSPSFTIDTLEILVLDEADRMLDDGFADELEEILQTIPRSRQTMLFSATMTESIDKLIRVGLNRPVRILVDAKQQTAGTLTQEFVRIRQGREDKRLAHLVEICKKIHTERVIVFFRQKREVHRTRAIFLMLGLKAAELHGDMTQEQRIHSVEEFRSGRANYLLATDLASRGLDIKGVDTIINFEAPQSLDVYLHRVGRTARAGRSGRACTIAAESDRKIVRHAVKNGKKHGAKLMKRSVDPTAVDEWAKKLDGMEDEILAILKEEQEEKQIAQARMQIDKGENLITHHDEIMSRPKRTWFQSEKDKLAAKAAGKLEQNGTAAQPKQKGKKKLSNKEKKKLELRDLRKGGNIAPKKSQAVRQGFASKKVKGSKKKK